MPKKPQISDASTLRGGGRSAAEVELRRRAEARLAGSPKGRRIKAGDKKSPADSGRVIHELEVHQVELELQNEELSATRDELEATLQKYTDLYDFAPVSYLTLDAAGNIRESNLAAATLLGLTRAALMNRRFGLFVSPIDRPAFGDFLGKVFVSGVREKCEVNLASEDQPAVAVQMEAIVFESGQTCRVAVTDITAHKRAEAEHLILDKLESTGILAGGLAHDFNNLLTVILLDLELAGTLTPPGGEQAQLLEEAKQAAVVASGLTRQLIAFASGGTMGRKPTRLAGVIREAIGPVLTGTNVRCEFLLAKDLWMVEVDAGQIGQAIRGIVLNAREAMPQGGVVDVRAENVLVNSAEQPSLSAGKYVRLSIADQGMGIAKVVLPKIFDPYFSTKERGTQKGMGLGLTICHSVIKRHGGTIAVTSTVGAGTVFTIHLPADRKLSRGAKAAVPAGVPRPGRVLVMDDEEPLRKIVALTLRRMGHQVEVAENGEQAIKLYKKARSAGRHFDAVILDLLVREGMGGRETLETLLKLDPATQAIAMSGYLCDPVILEPARHGFKGTLVKPFDVRKLLEMLARVMGANRTP